MSFYKNLLLLIPEVKNPKKKLSLKTRMWWTFLVLVIYLFLATIPLFGIDATQASYFQTLELLLGAKIGKLLTLGIGPIVTASIVLQLLKGAGILDFDINDEYEKFLYSGTHKLFTFIFILLEAFVYVSFGAVKPMAGWFLLVVLELALGGFLVYYLDEVVTKWGIGSGVSLFIAAGIGQRVFIQLFSPLTSSGALAWPFGSEAPVGKLFAALYYMANPDLGALLRTVLGPVGITILLFFAIVFFQSVNVEIPLSFGRIRGQSIKWPLNFFYSGVIPIILVSALRANLQLWARLLQNHISSGGVMEYISKHIIGQVDMSSGTPISGIIHWLYPIRIWTNLGNIFTMAIWPHILSYIVFMIFGSMIFSYFWVQSSGMDAKNQAKSILDSGLQIPGFRKDAKIIERVLGRYIMPLTIMGGVGIGLLAATADVLSALTSGTGILLLIMIIYQFYQEIAKESMDDFSLLRKLLKK